MMSKQTYRLLHLLLICFFNISFAQPFLNVTSLEGTAKIQESQKQGWDNLMIGDKIRDNDILETYFQTKLTMQYGAKNLIILGSNTKALININKAGKNDSKFFDIKITLFSGGALIKVKESSKASIFTQNAVARTDSGTISSVLEAKTGYTGFQTLGGSVYVRSISQQQEKKLNVGLTTIIRPDKELSAPLYITSRHVSVLKRFFGEIFIDNEIKNADIKPTQDKRAANRLSLSESMQQKQDITESKIYKRVFTKDKIYSAILSERKRNEKNYIPIKECLRPFDNKGEIEFITSFAFAGGKTYQKYFLIPSFHFPKFAFGLNLPLAKNSTGRMSMNFGTTEGFLDKFRFLYAGDYKNSRYVKLGIIKDLTFAKGLIVNNFSNKNIYTVTQPLGITMQVKNDLIDVNAFISDMSNWRVGGFHISLFPSTSWLGCGYYYDINQYKGFPTTAISRFINLDTIDNTEKIFPDQESFKSNCHIYELNFGMEYKLKHNMFLELHLQIAGKISKKGIDGSIAKLPELCMKFDNFDFGISYIVETGKLVYGHFGSMYMSNRLRIDSIANNTVYYSTQNNLLSKERRSYGICGFFNMTPVKGTSINFSIKQDFYAPKTFSYFKTGEDDTSFVLDTKNTKNDFVYSISFSMNEKLLPFIKYAKIYLNQDHGSYYPKGGKIFASWGFDTGFDFLTGPLVYNTAFEGGLKFTYIDLFDSYGNFGFLNNNIDSNDYLIEFYLGLRWGFL